MADIRTARVKYLEESVVHIVRSGFTQIVGVGQIITITAANDGVQKLDAFRGAGETGTVDMYAIALKAVNAVTTFTIDGKTLSTSFAAGDPPGTMKLIDSGDIAGALVVSAGVAGDQFAIVKRPPAFTDGLIPYVTAKSVEFLDIRRPIRDRGALNHRKKMAQQGGVLNLTAKYENVLAGLGKFVDQEIVIILEREDNRDGTVVETEFYYGAHIPALPGPNESEGDTDTAVTVAVNFELHGTLLED